MRSDPHPIDVAFDLEWRRNYAVRQLFADRRDIAFEVFREVWNMAIDEAISNARLESQPAAEKVRELKRDHH